MYTSLCVWYVCEKESVHACAHTWGLTTPHLGLQTPVVPLLLVSPCFGVLTEEGLQGAESGPRTGVLPLTWPDSDPPTSAGVSGTPQTQSCGSQLPHITLQTLTQP